MSKLICLFLGVAPVLIITLGSYLARTALDSSWAEQPANIGAGSGGPRQHTEYGQRYVVGRSLIVGGQVLLAGVIALGVIAACLSVIYSAHP
ncbi:hypothetical protein [Paraburkholderia sp. A3RO-2L]|uniref:hypothetical protein n=1 Tax=unclassified Paraburkholderia TaxID=2615204 RepID=UPI003DA9E4C2